MELTTALMGVHSNLFKTMGDPCWWPGEGPLEIAIGAVLTQNTAWSNVEKAIFQLKLRDLLSVDALVDVSVNEISSTIRSAGYHNQKAGYLKELAMFVSEKLDGKIEMLGDMDLFNARDILLDIKGIGRETADSILCYSADHSILVIDAYTRRIMSRYFGPPLSEVFMKGKYDQVQKMLMSALRGDEVLYNRFHALLVLHGKGTCRKIPICSICCLGGSCDHSKNSF